jgi:nitronate monooxygenase
MPLKVHAEQDGRADFTALWAGQAAALARDGESGALTQALASEALTFLDRLGVKTH